MSYRRYWPEDRVRRFQQLQKMAKESGLTLKIRSAGDRHIRVFCMTLWRGETSLGFTVSIDEAEQMVRQAGR